MSILKGPVYIEGDLFCSGNLPAFPRSSLNQEDNARYAIPWDAWRVHDAYGKPLPGDGQVEEAVESASFRWDPNSVDDSFFVAVRGYRVVGIIARIEVVGTDGGAVTAAIKKAASGTDIASGTALHSSTINLKGTVNTNQTLTLSVTSTDLDIAAGTCIGIDFTGTLTSARGCVTILLAPAASPDDLRLVGGTFGTGSPSIQTGNLKNAGATTRYARVTREIPHEYVTGQSITLRLRSGMVTTIASAAATVDVEAYESNGEAGIGADICATDAQSINSLTFAPKDFTITPTSILPGDRIDFRVAVTVNDSATVTDVIGCIGEAELLIDAKG